MSNIHIYAPVPTAVFCRVNDCPTCERPRRMLGKAYEWHGTTWTCAGCGEQWTDGWRHERPFIPGWRRDNVRYARRELANIGVTA